MKERLGFPRLKGCFKMQSDVVIIDYGMGNLRSVQKGLEKVGLTADIITGPERLYAAPGVILPGVGAFADAMENLDRAGFIPAIKEVVARGKPLLGICLGLQLLFSESEENGLHRGLDLIPGRVVKLPAGLKVPHMGWNQLEIKRQSPLLKGISNGDYFYFVHSYYVVPEDDRAIIACTEYGIKVPAIVGSGNLFGIQFHPEKSSDLGLRILKNFGELVKC